MLFGEAILINGGEMGFGAVADVLFEMIVGIFLGKLYHVMISCDLGDNRGSRDFADEGVCFYAD